MTKTKMEKRVMFPPTIPKERGNGAQWLMVVLSIIIVFTSIISSITLSTTVVQLSLRLKPDWQNDTIWGLTAMRCSYYVHMWLEGGIFFVKDNKLLYIFSTSSICLLTKLAEELFCRGCMLLEEWKHLPSRYNDSPSTIIKDVFMFSPITYLISFIVSTSTVFFISIYGSPLQLASEFGCIPIVLAFLGISILSRQLKLDYGPVYQSMLITKLNGMDYGSSMAHSYFYGYLKLMLPNEGNGEKGVKEMMEIFESKEDIVFARHKLLVLIPLSMYCPSNIEEASKIVEQSKSLPEKRLTRAGVRDRVYKNTVYKIHKDNKKIYICTEYATPLKTLHEVISHNSFHSNRYKKHCKDLVLHFYLTLKDLLEQNQDCKNNCELIFFDDLDKNGQRVDVGNVILNHLKQIKKLERKLSENKTK